jgi:hypothetical protein
MGQPSLLFQGQGKKQRGVTVELQKMNPSDAELNRDDSFDFESIGGVSLGKHASMQPVRPGKRTIGRGSLTNSQYFVN